MKRLVRPNQPKLWTRRSMLLAMAGAGLTVPACDFSQLFSWNGGKPVIFGYSSAPNFDRRYKTIRVKIFKDPTFWAVMPVPNLEMELTQYIIERIEQDTPYKVCSGDADTELSGSIVSFFQMSLNYNQLNEIREVETTMVCAVRWQDLRTGQILSWPSPRNLEPPPPAGLMPGQQDPLNATNAPPGSMLTQPLTAAPVSPAGNQATMMDDSPQSNPGNPTLGQTNAPGASGGAPIGPMPTGNAGMLGSVLVRSEAYYRPEIGESLATAEQSNCQSMAQQIVNMMEIAW
ncbi:MAG TPA: LPS assembly lipoprotein LptE [Gemmataceae bacterium]|nr:LPS assembly lipoprotein LptE [Gemmataceae bacterium]